MKFVIYSLLAIKKTTKKIKIQTKTKTLKSTTTRIHIYNRTHNSIASNGGT